MTTQTLIPDSETHGMAATAVLDESSAASSDGTGQRSGGIIRERILSPQTESGTGWPQTEVQATNRVQRLQLASPLIRLAAGSLPKERIRVLQQWEGVVTDVGEDSFWADLQDLGDSSLPIEIVELPIEEGPEDDRDLLVEGGIFYWSIGYETSVGGQLRRMSEIRLRRTPRWTKRAIQRVRQRAEELFELHGQQ